MSSKSPTPADGLLKTSVASASSLMALQLLSRGFTFGLNQALFRIASPTSFGAASIQFELILSTILFLSREGVRNSLLRVPKDSNSDKALRRTNLSFLPIFLGIPLALSTSFLYAHYAGSEMKQQPYFVEAIALYALAAVTELFSEPLYNVAMTTLQTGVRVRAEGVGITLRSIITFLVLFYDSQQGKGDLALVAFAFGQLAYSVAMFASYSASLGFSHMRPKPSSSSGKAPLSHIDSEALRLSGTMTMQSLVKHFLTEGDKIVLSWFSPLHDQGGYAIAVNYGSLIARIIFQPIEETLRVFFSRILGSNSKETTEGQAALTQSLSTLQSLLSVQISLSMIFVVFGSAYMPTLLGLLLPKQYLGTSAPSVLAAWVWYIPVLAINGGLEAFLSSVATPGDLNKQSRWMIVFSMIYIATAIVFYRLGLGDSSLVYANIINLSVRIVYCLRFVDSYFQRSSSVVKFHWNKALPPRSLCVVSAVSASALLVSERRLTVKAVALSMGRRALLEPSVMLHVSIGGALAAVCLSTWWMNSGRHLNLPLRRSKVE